MLDDIKIYHNYVLSSVRCNWGSEIVSTFKLAILLYAPLQLRLERIKQREITRFGNRVLEGGDMYESQKRFHGCITFCRGYKAASMFAHLPIIGENATMPVKEILGLILSYYYMLDESSVNSNLTGGVA